MKRFLTFILTLLALYVVVTALICGIMGALAAMEGHAASLDQVWATGAPAAERFFRQHALSIWLGALVVSAGAIYRWNGLGISIIVAFGTWFFFKGTPSPERMEESAPVVSTPPPATPVPVTPPPLTGTPQQRALQAYPQLAVANSPLNREFLRRHTKYKAENPRFFDDPEWPTKLAKESSEALAKP